MVELGIVGAKNSGKTTLIEELVARFCKLGLVVGTVKHSSHNHTFDTEGKDSYRHRLAGAQMTLAMSESDAALFFPPDTEQIDQVRQLINRSCDICLIEGDRATERARIVLTRGDKEHAYELRSGGIASYGPTPLDSGLPHFDLDDIAGLTAFIMEHFSLSASEVRGAQ